MHLRERYPQVPWLIVASIVVVDLLILATTAWILTASDQSTIVTRSEVLADYHATLDEETEREALSEAPPPASAPSTIASPSQSVSEPGVDPTQAVTSAPPAAPTARASERSASPTPAAIPTPIGYRQPDPGVYEYATTGYETVSLLGGRHDYPERTYASLHLGSGCGWRMELQVVEEHVDEWRMCSDPWTLVRDWHSRTITWFGITTNGYYDCGEPLVHDRRHLAEGATTSYSECTDDNGSFADVDVTLHERMPVEVGGQAIDAVHVRIVMTSTGTTRGTTVDEYWMAAGTGMILRMERAVDATSDTQLGTVDYRERATFTLTSLVPVS